MSLSNRLSIAGLATICLITLAIGLFCTLQQLAKPYPLHQWESALLMESHRVAIGEPIYVSLEQDHATMMYGPFLPYVMGIVFHFCGPTFLVARLFSVMSFAIAAYLIVFRLRPDASWLSKLIGLSLLALAGSYVLDFAEPRPDGVSFLAGYIAIIALYLAHTRQSWRWHTFGLVAIVIAINLKQTAAMVCAVPVTAILIQWRYQPNRKQIAMALSAFLPLALVLLFWKTAVPNLFHAAVDVPRQYSIRINTIPYWCFSLVYSLMAVWFNVAFYCLMRSKEAQRVQDTKLGWIVAACIVLVPSSIVAASKVGGVGNSVLPGMFALVALGMITSSAFEHGFLYPKKGVPQFSGMGWCMVAGMIASVWWLTPLQLPSRYSRFGDRTYETVIEVSRSLPGEATCLQDPALIVFATGQTGRSLVLEADAIGWPDPLPDYVFDRCRHADYVVTLGQRDDFYYFPLTATAFERRLKDLDFVPAPELLSDDSIYLIWKRKRNALVGSQQK